MNAPKCGNAAVRIVSQRCDKQLQGFIRLNFWAWYSVKNGCKQRFQIVSQFCSGSSTAGCCLCIHDRKIRLCFRRTEFNKQVKGLIYNQSRISTTPVNFIDHNHRLMPHFQRLFQHKSGLRHWAFRCIHKEQYAIDHVHYTFYFPAKISMTGCINNIYLYLLVGFLVPHRYSRIL